MLWRRAGTKPQLCPRPVASTAAQRPASSQVPRPAAWRLARPGATVDDDHGVDEARCVLANVHTDEAAGRSGRPTTAPDASGDGLPQGVVAEGFELRRRAEAGLDLADGSGDGSGRPGWGAEVTSHPCTGRAALLGLVAGQLGAEGQRGHGVASRRAGRRVPAGPLSGSAGALGPESPARRAVAKRREYRTEQSDGSTGPSEAREERTGLVGPGVALR